MGVLDFFKNAFSNASATMDENGNVYYHKTDEPPNIENAIAVDINNTANTQTQMTEARSAGIREQAVVREQPVVEEPIVASKQAVASDPVLEEKKWRACYDNIMQDIANSDSMTERRQKVQYYTDTGELKAFRDSGINVDNDLAHLVDKPLVQDVVDTVHNWREGVKADEAEIKRAQASGDPNWIAAAQELSAKNSPLASLVPPVALVELYKQAQRNVYGYNSDDTRDLYIKAHTEPITYIPDTTLRAYEENPVRDAIQAAKIPLDMAYSATFKPIVNISSEIYNNGWQHSDLGEKWRTHPAAALAEGTMAVLQAVAPLDAARTKLKMNAAESIAHSPAAVSQELASAEKYTPGPDGLPGANFNIMQEAYKSQGFPLDFDPEIMDMYKNKYPVRDSFSLEIIPQGTNLVRLEPGDTYFMEYNNATKAIIDSRDATLISEGCQVAPHLELGYRKKLSIWEVTEDIPVAAGKALANKQYGEGGFKQAYIEGWKELEAKGILQNKGVNELTNFKPSEVRYEEMNNNLAKEIETAWEIERRHPVNVINISKTLQDALYEAEQVRIGGLGERVAKQQQWLRDSFDMGNLVKQVEVFDRKSIVELRGPVNSRNVLRQSDQLVEQLKQWEIDKIATQEQKIATELTFLTASHTVASDKTTAEGKQLLALKDDFSAVHMVKAVEVHRTLVNKDYSIAGEIEELYRQRTGLAGEPMTEEQARGLAMSDYLQGADKQLGKQVQAIQAERVRLQEDEAWNINVGQQNKFDAPYLKYVPNWLKGDGLKDYEHNLAVIEQRKQQLELREAENTAKMLKLQERLQTPEAKAEIDQLIPAYLAKDQDRQGQLAKLDAKIKDLTLEQKDCREMRKCISYKMFEQPLRIEGDVKNPANIIRQFDQIKEQVQKMPEQTQQQQYNFQVGLGFSR